MNRCPSCNSPSPERHPAVQFEGEGQLCIHPFHTMPGEAPLITSLRNEIARLKTLISTPHTDDFLEAVPIEAAFQIDHWGTGHDEGKKPSDWYWLTGYLAGKACNAATAGDLEKAKHHTISTAAAMLNWYRRMSGEDQSFRPGIAEPKEVKKAA